MLGTTSGDPAAAGVPMEEVPCPACASDAGRVAFTARGWASNRADLVFAYRRCGGCGALYLSPRVAATAIASFYPPGYHPSGEGADGAGQVATLERMGAAPPPTLLDWGCGRGGLVEALARRGVDAYGYEPFDPVGAPSARIKHRLDDVEALLPRMQAVTMLDVLEHLYEPAQVLTTIARRSDADVIVSVPRGDHPEVDMFRGHAFVVQAPTHLFLPTRLSLARLAARAGYAVEWLPDLDTEFWRGDWRLFFGASTFPAQRPRATDRAANQLARLVAAIHRWLAPADVRARPGAHLTARFVKRSRPG